MRKFGAVLVWAVLAGALGSQPAMAQSSHLAMLSSAKHHKEWVCKDGTKAKKKKECKKHGGVDKKASK